MKVGLLQFVYVNHIIGIAIPRLNQKLTIRAMWQAILELASSNHLF